MWCGMRCTKRNDTKDQIQMGDLGKFYFVWRTRFIIKKSFNVDVAAPRCLLWAPLVRPSVPPLWFFVCCRRRRCLAVIRRTKMAKMALLREALHPLGRSVEKCDLVQSRSKPSANQQPDHDMEAVRCFRMEVVDQWPLDLFMRNISEPSSALWRVKLVYQYF